MRSEIKLYILTRFFEALYNGNMEKVMAQLMELLHSKHISEGYWEKWAKRYETIALSKEVQVTMLREANYPYRKIQDMLGVSPNTITRIIALFEIDYTELEETHKLEDNLERISARLKEAGVELW